MTVSLMLAAQASHDHCAARLVALQYGFNRTEEGQDRPGQVTFRPYLSDIGGYRVSVGVSHR